MGLPAPRRALGLGWDGVLGVEVHLPAALPQHPDGADVGVAGHGVGAEGRAFDWVVDDGRDPGSEEGYVRVKHLYRSKAEPAEEHPDEVKDLAAIPDLLLHAGEVR